MSITGKVSVHNKVKQLTRQNTWSSTCSIKSNEWKFIISGVVKETLLQIWSELCYRTSSRWEREKHAMFKSTEVLEILKPEVKLALAKMSSNTATGPY